MADTIQRAESRTRPLSILDLGLISYPECWELQKRLASDRAEGAVDDTLLLLEHPHTYTCGRRGGRDHILITEQELQERGIAVLDVDRGGDVTYHGPGQLVGYPIVRLAEEGQVADYHAYLRALEQVLIDTLARFAISASRVPGYSGVWVRGEEGEEKIAAVGVKVDGRGVSSHGIALNVSTDLRYFSYIVPCGIAEKGVTSMQRLLGTPPEMQEVKSAFSRAFCAVFGFNIRLL
jgi:lipoyl(octanoyl) transferase